MNTNSASPAAIHANFLKIANTGTLIIGEAGIGKSLLSLELLDRGHVLISDDLVEIIPDQAQAIGACPINIMNYLHVRQLGLIKIDQHFPNTPKIKQYPIHLMIKIVKANNTTKPSVNPKIDHITLAGHTIPQIELVTQIQSSLALLVETLIKNFEFAADNLLMHLTQGNNPC